METAVVAWFGAHVALFVVLFGVRLFRQLVGA